MSAIGQSIFVPRVQSSSDRLDIRSLYTLAFLSDFLAIQWGDQHPEARLNIVPVDYVAKAVVNALRDDSLTELNIVHAKPPKHAEYIAAMLGEIGITNYELVDELPSAQNAVEKHYYRSVAVAFNPYITTPDARFDAGRLLDVFPMKQADVGRKMRGLIRYAVENEFKDGLIPRNGVFRAADRAGDIADSNNQKGEAKWT